MYLNQGAWKKDRFGPAQMTKRQGPHQVSSKLEVGTLFVRDGDETPWSMYHGLRNLN